MIAVIFEVLPAEGRPGAVVVPFAAIAGLGMPHHDLLRSARPGPARSALAERLTFGYVLRDLRRVHSHICSVAYPVLDAAGELPVHQRVNNDLATLSAHAAHPAPTLK